MCNDEVIHTDSIMAQLNGVDLCATIPNALPWRGEFSPKRLSNNVLISQNNMLPCILTAVTVQ